MPLAKLTVDAHQITNLERIFADAGKRAPAAIRRALNRTLTPAKRGVVKALIGQTGLSPKTIKKAVKTRGSKGGVLAAVLYSRGGDVALKYFKPRETRGGVSAAPWNKRQVFAGTFTRGGLWPNRKALALNGQVFMPVGKQWRGPIHKVHSGLFIPVEMVQGASAAEFFSVVERVLPARVEHELMAILAGYAPGK